LSESDFRRFLPPHGHKKIVGATARAHAEQKLMGPRAQELFGTWRKMLDEPFKGVTTAGRVIPDLFSLRHENAPTAAMVEAANRFLARLSDEQREAACLAIDSRQWRNWQNTEIYVDRHGLRLEEIAPPLRDAAMAVLRAGLSPKGFQMSRDVMRLNRFLGDLVGGPHILGEWSYIFCLFGAPSMSEPWGWQIFGHHLCVSCLVIDGQMALSPLFWGAEPSHADDGPFAGIRLFEDEERAGLDLMRSLDAAQRERAIVAHSMIGGDLPEGRRHFADNLHLGGAHQDNRIIPYEGIEGSELSKLQRRGLMDLVEAYLAPLPPGPLSARIGDVERHLDDTHFCWIGGTGEDSTFYYRIQSPVVMIEFDHHCGVFLINEEPEKFHVHTLVRTPNGNDYGLDLLRLHYERAPHHRRD
jgi:hypothetical protein